MATMIDLIYAILDANKTIFAVLIMAVTFVLSPPFLVIEAILNQLLRLARKDKQ